MKYFVNVNPYKDTKNVVDKIHNIMQNKGWVLSEEPTYSDLSFAIGGDGTFIDTASLTPNAEILGINKGTLGFLTDLDEQDIDWALEKYFNKQYLIENRMMLEASIVDTDYKNVVALNDINITRANASIVDLDVYVDDILITSYKADGIIIATPTGATGYAFSCGAPIVDPTSDMIILAAIAPHTMLNRSIIVSSKSKIDIVLAEARGDDKARLVVDGNSIELKKGQMVSIKKSDRYIKVIKFNKTSFLEKLRTKLS